MKRIKNLIPIKNSKKKKRPLWPKPKYDENDEPHFLFILTPPYSGSTALCSLINSSTKTMILHKKGEGQWIVPGMCGHDRWNPNKKFNYKSIKAVWLHRYQLVQELTRNIDVVIEKSPPNILRLQKLLDTFKNHSILANNRNPYAVCSSALYRSKNIDQFDDEQRKQQLSNAAQNWLSRSKTIMQLIQAHHIPFISYEAFCDNPSSVINFLNLPDGVIDTIDPDTNVKVKDYKPQKISNQNQRQIQRLNKEEIETVRNILIAEPEVLEFFGYTA